MNNLKYIIASVFITFLSCFNAFTCVAEEDDLIWRENRDEIFKMAMEQNKYVFLLVGNDDCGNCKAVRGHLDDNTAPLKQIIKDNYILWYSRRDVAKDRAEVKIYTNRYDEQAQITTMTLPFLYIIDPNTPEEYVVSSWGYKSVEALKTMLSVHLTPNEIVDVLKNKVVISGNVLHVSNDILDEHIRIYTVTGHCLSSVYKKEYGAVIDVSSLPKGIVIIRSSKGWSAKLFNN